MKFKVIEHTEDEHRPITKSRRAELQETYRAMLHQNYAILLEDVEKTYNINCHTFDTFACSIDEAIGKMVQQRPEFRVDKIVAITIY